MFENLLFAGIAILSILSLVLNTWNSVKRERALREKTSTSLEALSKMMEDTEQKTNELLVSNARIDKLNEDLDRAILERESFRKMVEEISGRPKE